MVEAKNYMLHASGVYALIAWMEQQRELGLSCKVEGSTITLPVQAGEYFSLGVSRRVRSAKNAFLCIQANEARWIKLIDWNYIAVREDDNNVYLVSNYVFGNGSSLDDFGVIAVSIPFDLSGKFNFLKKAEKIDGREYRVDVDTNQIFIDLHSKVFSLPVKIFDRGENILGDISEYKILKDAEVAESVKGIINKYKDVNFIR